MSEDVPLNDGLKKVAGDNALNREQVQRVAESANTETYLGLMKTAKENYVDFDLADYRQVYEGLSKTASAPFAIDDYDTDYEQVAVEFAEDITEAESLEKTASENLTKTAAEANREAVEARETMKFLDNAAYESISSIDHGYDSLEKEAKQIILSGTPFNNISEILKVASEYAEEPLTTMLKNRLSKYAPYVDLEKTAEVEGVVNTSSKLYKIASKIQDDTIKYLKIEDAIEESLDILNERFSNPEQLKKFSILPRDFTIDDGELTPTLKIRRKQINENWSDIIDSMYAE